MIWYIFSLNQNGRWRNWWRDWFDVAIARSILLPSASALHNWCNHVSNMSIRLSWSACYLSGIYSHFTDTRAFSWGRALKLSNAVLLAVGISVEFPKVLEGVKGGDFVRTSQLCPHSISSHFFFSCWTSLKLLPRSSKEEAECCWKQPLDQRQNWTAAVQEKKKTLWPIIYLWGKHIWCWFFRNWQAICSKALQKANIILSLLRLFQVGSKWGRSLLSFFFWVISFFHVFLSCLLSAPWLSITADYSLRPDFNPPVCVYVFQPALLIMWVFFYICLVFLNLYVC